MERFTIESTIDDNTGLECWLIVDNDTGSVIDRAFDQSDARDIRDYYQDMADDPYDYDGQPTELEEWMDFDPDC
jgi:hypothetical protein